MQWRSLIADKEAEDLHSGKDFGGSMAGSVPFDTCSQCGNEAKTRADYCTGTDEGGHCKAGAPVKNRMGQVLEDGSQLYVDNPSVRWFDWSRVWRPADRIAYATGIVKAAGVFPMGGAALAEAWGLTTPPRLFADSSVGIKLAAQLAELEGRVNSHPRNDPLTLGLPWPEAVEGYIGESLSGHGSSIKQALTALAREKISLPVESFLELIGCDQEKAAANKLAIAARLPESTLAF